MKTPLIEQFEKEGHPYYSSARWVSISNWEKHVSAAINIVNTFLDSFSLNSNIGQVVIMSVFLTWNNVLLPKREIYETLCVIWYHLYNLNVTLFMGVFYIFLNCTNGAKSCKTSHMIKVTHETMDKRKQRQLTRFWFLCCCFFLIELSSFIIFNFLKCIFQQIMCFMISFAFACDN